MATTKNTTPAASPVKESVKRQAEVDNPLLNKGIDPHFITEEQRVKIVTKYPTVTQSDFDRRDGEYHKDVFARVAKKIGLTGQQLTDYFGDK